MQDKPKTWQNWHLSSEQSFLVFNSKGLLKRHWIMTKETVNHGHSSQPSRPWDTLHQVMSAVVSSYLSQNITSKMNIFCQKMTFQNQIPFTTSSLLYFHPLQQLNEKLFISLSINYPTRVTNPTSLFWAALEQAMVSPGVILLQENVCCCKAGTDNAIPFNSSWPSHQKEGELFCAYISLSLDIYISLYI